MRVGKNIKEGNHGRNFYSLDMVEDVLDKYDKLTTNHHFFSAVLELNHFVSLGAVDQTTRISPKFLVGS